METFPLEMGRADVLITVKACNNELLISPEDLWLEETAWDLPLGNKRVVGSGKFPYCVGEMLKQESELLVGRPEPRVEDRSKKQDTGSLP